MNYAELADIAKYAVLKVMNEGEATYPRNDFMDRPFADHAEHALQHIYNLTDTGLDRKVELEHALTRLTIMLAQL